MADVNINVSKEAQLTIKKLSTSAGGLKSDEKITKHHKKKIPEIPEKISGKTHIIPCTYSFRINKKNSPESTQLSQF